MTQSQVVNMGSQVVGIVLAAGSGKRMRSPLPKVAHLLKGRPLLYWALDSLFEAGISEVVVVVSPHHPQVHALVEGYPRPCRMVFQDPPQGTGHAVQVALPMFEQQLKGKLVSQFIVAYGDCPAVTPQTFQKLIAAHKENDFTVLAFHPADPTGYGRILQENGKFQGIQEEKDCTAQQKQIRICNSGFLCASFRAVETFLPQLSNQNAAQEYYLTDLPTLCARQGGRVGVVVGEDAQELMGVNSPEQLAGLEESLKT